MEELRSTEILDKEIQSDARKKAERILAKADVDCQMILSEVDERIEKAKNEISEKNKIKVTNYEKEHFASLPLEKERFLVDFIQKSINKAIDEFLQKMPEEERLNLVVKQLEKAKNLFAEKKVALFVYGFNLSSVEKKVSKLLKVDSCAETEFNKIIVENDCGLSKKEGIIVETVDKSVRSRFTFSEIVSQIQYKYRNELYEALFGGRLENK